MSDRANKPQVALSKAELRVIEVARDPVLAQMLEQERVASEEVDASLLWKLLAYLKRHRALVSASVGLSLIEALLMTLPPYAVGMAVDVVRQQPRIDAGAIDALLLGLSRGVEALLPASLAGARGAVVGFGLVILICWALRWLVAVSATYIVQRLGQRIVHDLRMDVYQHIVAMDMGFFHKNPVGRLVNRATFDTQSLSEFFSDAFAQGLRDVLFIIALMVVMLTLDVPLSLILLLTFPLLGVCAGIYRSFARPAMRTTSAVLSRMNAWMAENIAGMRENQLYGLEDRRRAEHASLTNAHQASVTSWIRAWGLLRPVMMGVCAVATGLILWVGYGRVLAGVVSVGVLLTFLQYTTKLWVPVRNLSEKFSVIQSALTATERIFDILSRTSQLSDAPDADTSLAVKDGHIVFDHVRFRYPRQHDEVLRGVSFEAKPGQMIALVGDTGAGKSTIAHLLSRFYDVSEGAVRVDGHDVRAFTLHQLRRGMALVPQDVVIFAGSVRDNITLGLEVCDEVVWQAARAVCADRFIDRLEGGLDHPMDEGGRTLSAGERQLVSFARALVFNPPILILDEATANVDTETEALVQEALARLTAGRTSVVVAHRLSTIRDADQILVLRHGEVIERGTHEVLLGLGGEYARLHALHMGQARD